MRVEGREADEQHQREGEGDEPQELGPRVDLGLGAVAMPL